MTKKHTKADYFRTSRKNKMAATLLLTTGLVAAGTMPALAADEDNNAEPATTVAPSVVTTPATPTTGDVTVIEADPITSEDGNTIKTITTTTHPDAKRNGNVPTDYEIPATANDTVTKTSGTDNAGNETVTTVDTTTTTRTVNLVNKTTTYTEETSPDKTDEKYLKEETVKSDVETTVVTTITAVETTIDADKVPEYEVATSQGGKASDVKTAEDGSKSITVTMPDGTVYTYQVTETTTTVSGPAVTVDSTLEQKTQAFLDSLAVTGNFVVYADTFNENGHIDGNIAVNELQTNVKEKNLT